MAGRCNAADRTRVSPDGRHGVASFVATVVYKTLWESGRRTFFCRRGLRRAATTRCHKRSKDIPGKSCAGDTVGPGTTGPWSPRSALDTDQKRKDGHDNERPANGRQCLLAELALQKVLGRKGKRKLASAHATAHTQAMVQGGV